MNTIHYSIRSFFYQRILFDYSIRFKTIIRGNTDDRVCLCMTTHVCSGPGPAPDCHFRCVDLPGPGPNGQWQWQPLILTFVSLKAATKLLLFCQPKYKGGVKWTNNKAILDTGIISNIIICIIVSNSLMQSGTEIKLNNFWNFKVYLRQSITLKLS